MAVLLLTFKHSIRCATSAPFSSSSYSFNVHVAESVVVLVLLVQWIVAVLFVQRVLIVVNVVVACVLHVVIVGLSRRER